MNRHTHRPALHRPAKTLRPCQVCTTHPAKPGSSVCKLCAEVIR